MNEMQNLSRDMMHQQITPSPFHRGEQEIQTRTGKREVMEKFAQRVIRSFMPDQHRQFYEELPFMVVGGVDDNGWPWASLLSGKPGFMRSPNPVTLTVNAALPSTNPLASVLKKPGSPVGLLGIEMMARRRNRLNGRIEQTNSSGFSIKVDQSFGNCPQYIQNWDIDFVRDPQTVIPDNADLNNIVPLAALDDEARDMISGADTFFVSSYIQTKDRPEIEGVDVSHRGGRPGFVKVEGNILTIPDYPGNYHFNTLGNFLVNPKGGLVFIDFSSGDLLMLTGTVELLWENEAEVVAFKGAERAWRFTMDHGVRLKDALPFRASMKGYSPNTLLAGDWDQANASLAAEAKREAWRPFKLTRIEKESSVICSFYFEPADGDGLLLFQAGQFLTIRITPPGGKDAVVRTYTISSAPGESYYRISVKRENEGQISQALHDSLNLGDIIEVKAPKGEFFIDASEKRPAVLLGGGVGITPMISMASQVIQEGLRTRNLRPLTILHASKTINERAFTKDFQAIEKQSQGAIRYYSYISKPEKSDKPDINFNGSGHITADILRQVLALDDYDFYLCGPPAFMQALYDGIRSLGVRDARIFAEAFGPAAITRQADDVSASASTENEADEAIIKFAKSGFEQRWNIGDATLLETAEHHGLTPSFDCRNGACGSCAVKLISGSITYRRKPTATPEEGEVLICCAVPKKESPEQENSGKINAIEIDL
ncbi:MAG: ferredoxin-NADP reductase [Gammaproteobacteria bacterium]|jgi:ferredoxin-NADP reductase/predicted pyridoxine 5'-phosphate oxidase superfamily flavin-nucleotide-binding protein